MVCNPYNGGTDKSVPYGGTTGVCNTPLREMAYVQKLQGTSYRRGGADRRNIGGMAYNSAYIAFGMPARKLVGGQLM